MPPATEFTALGAGNGFPRFRDSDFPPGHPLEWGPWGGCLEKVRVDEFDYWTTLSGWSKINEPASEADKKQSIADSLRLAMKWYWNIYKMNLTTSIPDPSGGTISLGDINSEDDGKLGHDRIIDAILTPASRLCSGQPAMAKQSEDNDPGYFGNYLLGSLVFGAICRIYDGPEDDEDNFRGYGLSYYGISVVDFFNFATVDIGGFGDVDYAVQWTDYCTIPITNSTDEFHAVCFAPNGNPANRHSSYGGTSITVDSLELYTY